MLRLSDEYTCLNLISNKISYDLEPKENLHLRYYELWDGDHYVKDLFIILYGETVFIPEYYLQPNKEVLEAVQNYFPSFFKINPSLKE